MICKFYSAVSSLSINQAWYIVKNLGTSNVFILVSRMEIRAPFITPPARRARRSFKFAPFLFFFSVSEVGAALMGDTAEHSRFEPNI